MSEELPEYNARQALVPVEEQTVDFYGDEIKGVAVMATPSKKVYYVPVRPLCEYLGVNVQSQTRRIDRDLVLSDVAATVVVSTAGGPQEALCLPLDYLNGWLFGINASRVSDEVRARVIRYQRECYQVLADAFQRPGAPPSPADPLAQVEGLGRALITLAREQRELGHQLEDHEARIIVLEDRLSPGEFVTEEQATQISQAVKAIAYELGKRSGRNEYGGIYGELYRRFEVTSYKRLPAGKFERAMAWLSEWYAQITNDEAPF